MLTAPSASAAEAPPHVLVFSGTYGFHHSSIEYGNAVLAELARETGEFTVEFSVNPADISAAKLATADLVLFNSTTGRTPLSQRQRDEFAQWIGCGGGFMGVHASADNNYGWPLYAELVGAQFEAHPQMANDPPVRMLVEDRDHPINGAWQGRGSFEIQDEIYRWRRDLRGTQDVNVLLALDETTVAAGPYVHRQPIAWTKTYRGASRVYYTNLGHNESTWDLAEFRASLVAGIQWVAGVRPGGVPRRRRVARDG
jgi:type 1 glutamine amidotransferase